MTNQQIQTNWSTSELLLVVLTTSMLFILSFFMLGNIQNPENIFKSPNRVFLFYWLLQWIVLFLPVFLVSFIRGGNKSTFLLNPVGVKKSILSIFYYYSLAFGTSLFLAFIVYSLGFAPNSEDILLLRGMDLSGTHYWHVFFIICIFSPVLEEVLFRGFVFPNFAVRMGKRWGSIFSAAIFGLMHFSFIKFFFTFVLGMILNEITYKEGSIIPAIFIHILNNTFTFVAVTTLLDINAVV